MSRPVAVHFALDLAAMPTLAGIIRREPLPSGVLDVIKIAAGCPETMERAVMMTNERPEDVRRAAIAYLQTALFAPSADYYRVLGVSRDASQDEIRLHMRWLMKWLHPDRQQNAWESTFAERVLGAWDELKSPERRARYDRLHPPADQPPSERSRRQWRRPWLPWVQWPGPTKRETPIWSVRLAVGIAIGAVALTIVLASDWLRRPGAMLEGSDPAATNTSGSVEMTVSAPAADR